MRIVKLMGGLGNQLFQYAAAKNIAINNKTTLLVDPITGFHKDPYNRSFALNNFCISSEIASPQLIKSLIGKNKISRYFQNKIQNLCPLIALQDVKERFYHFDEKLANLKTNSNMYLEGYFHSEKYFSSITNEILSEFELKYQADSVNSKYLAHINSSESVSLHVRTYDDAKKVSSSQIYGTSSKEYYQKAVDYMQNKLQNPVFFIFADDIDWASKNIVINNSKTEYISYNSAQNGHEDIRLMKACKHNIIANSSFSWWGAWLNKHADKMIIAPDKWLDTKKYNFKDVVPVNWIKI